MTPSSIDGLVDAPVVNFPAVYGSYKFVQLEVDCHPLLRFAETDWQTHAFVLQSALESLGISYGTQPSPLSGTMIPAPDGERYHVAGMGIGVVYPDEKRVLFDSSAVSKSLEYQLSLDAEHLNRIQLSVPNWTFKTF